MLLKLKVFLLEHRYMFTELKKKHKKELQKMITNNKNNPLVIYNKKNWINKLNKLTYSDPKMFELALAFSSDDIRLVKSIDVHPTDVLAICVVKNDLIKLKRFINHHRLLGIDKFVILDNNSSDGTISYLLKQNDVVILKTKTPYSSFRRLGWINRIISYYGYNRWYFVGDSDELLVYNDCENKTIKDLIDHCESSNEIRMPAIMLDMYANKEYYKNGSFDKYYDECVFFDSDTYFIKNHSFCKIITGGPRDRIFDVKATLTKYPLFYFRKNDIFRSHFLVPCYKNFDAKYSLALKHYKFLPGEFTKYKKIAKDGNYFNGSIEYKKYISVLKNKNIDFMCKCSRKYIDSSSLDEIPLYSRIKW